MTNEEWAEEMDKVFQREHALYLEDINQDVIQSVALQIADEHKVLARRMWRAGFNAAWLIAHRTASELREKEQSEGQRSEERPA